MYTICNKTDEGINYQSLGFLCLLNLFSLESSLHKIVSQIILLLLDLFVSSGVDGNESELLKIWDLEGVGFQTSLVYII